MAETEILDMKNINFKDIKDILGKGMARFAELREHWAEMAQFFQMTSNLVDVVLNKSIVKLTAEVATTANRKLKTLAG